MTLTQKGMMALLAVMAFFAAATATFAQTASPTPSPSSAQAMSPTPTTTAMPAGAPNTGFGTMAE